MSSLSDPGQGALPSAFGLAAPRGLRFLWLALALAALALLAGCTGTRGGPIPYEVENFNAPDTPAAVPLEEDYRIGPLDTLNVRVFQVGDLSGDFQVDLTGRISMPLIGEVRAIDMTTAQLDEQITQKLGEKYLQSPDVAVAVRTSTRRNVTVDGAVRSPGMYPIAGPTSLLQVIAMARGTDDNANPRRVAIFRQIEGQRMAAAFDLISIRKGNAEDPAIYNGDIIVVDGSNIRAAQREILGAIPIIGFFRAFSLGF